MGEKEVIKRSDKVYTREILKNEFIKFGLKPGMDVIIHSSLSKIGWVTGGPVTVIYSLMDVITEEGTISREVKAKFGPSEILLLPQQKGRGLVAA